MLRSYKNCEIKIDNEDLVASNLQLSVNASNEPALTEEKVYTDKLNNVGAIKGSAKVVYALTGIDPLKPYTQFRETGVISGNFGGLIIESGYLSSYSINASPNEPVFVNAEISFFDELRGSFNPTYKRAEKRDVFHFSDISIEHRSTESLGTIDNIESFVINYNANIVPSYREEDSGQLDSILPDRVEIQEKNLTLNLVTDNLDPDLPIQGKDGSVKITLKHPVEDISEIFDLNGSLQEKRLDVSSNNNLKAGWTLKQFYPGITPRISSFTPTSASPGDTVTINGSNLVHTLDVFFAGIESSGFTIVSDSRVDASVPFNADDGLIKVVTENGEFATGGFVFTSPDIVVNKFQTTANFGDSIFITGQNFFKISHVQFSGTSGVTTGEFEVIGNEIINTTVPDGAQAGKITIISTGNGKAGQTPSDFVPIPEIEGFDPETGMSGTHVLITGKGFASIDGVFFNNLWADIVDGPHELELTADVPSGNTFGFIKISGDREVFDLSSTKFFPQIVVDLIDPPSGRPGDSLDIFGQNFTPELMLEVESDPNEYYVEFGGGITGAFERINFGKLEGTVPPFAETGPVGILSSDNTVYPSDVIWTNISFSPDIESFFPPTGELTKRVAIQGSGFSYLEWVMLSGFGNGGNDIESGFSGDSSEVSQDTLGKLINLDVPFNMDTGNMNIVVKTLAGIDWSDTQLELTNLFVPGSSGISGVAGDQFSGNYGTYTATDETKTVVWHNVTDYDIRAVFPADDGISWDGNPSGQGYPIDISAKSSEDVSGVIVDDTYLSNLYVDLLGYFIADDDFSGNFNIYANLTP